MRNLNDIGLLIMRVRLAAIMAAAFVAGGAIVYFWH